MANVKDLSQFSLIHYRERPSNIIFQLNTLSFTVPFNEISHRLVLQTIKTSADNTEYLNYKQITTNLPTALTKQHISTVYHRS
jgi:hypothetical protein